MVKKKHLLYMIQEKKSGLVFWSALPPQDKFEKVIEKKMLPVEESLKLSISRTDVKFIKKEFKGSPNRKKKRLKKVV